MDGVVDPEIPDDIASVIRDVLDRSTPAQHGPNFDQLAALVDEELRAQIAIGRLGDIDPGRAEIHVVARLVADVVDRVYRLEERRRSTTERAATLTVSGGTVREARVLSEAGPHELPLAGRAVCLVAVSRFLPFLRLHFWGAGVPQSTPGPDYTLQVEGPLQITVAGREWTLDPRAGPHPTYLELVTNKVAQAVASDDGGLVVDFTDGDRLVVPPHEYEPWQLSGDDGSLFVSAAGGGLAVWDADDKTPD
jgi:hypothetical protein